MSISSSLAVPVQAPHNWEDPFGDEILADPLPFQERLRETGAVVHLAEYDVYGMGRYEEVRRALLDWQSFPSSAGVGLANFRTEKPWRPPSLLLEADPPLHNAPRSVLTKLLGPRAIRHLQEEWAVKASSLVDELLSRGDEFDAAKDLAHAFPLRVFPDQIGLGEEGREHLLTYGDHAFNAFGPANSRVQKGNETIAGDSAWVAEQCRRENLSADGFGAGIWAASDRGDITADQAPLIVRSLLTAGVDTTMHAIAAVLSLLAVNPAQWARLRSDPTLARVAFDEAIRLESPVQTFFRTADADVLVADTVIPEGSKILMFLGAANRDPRRWENPNAFDLSRDPSGHVGFGMGVHQCVGQHVARLEAVTLLDVLIRRIRAIEPAGEPTRHLNNTLRAWESLPVRVTLD